MTSRRLCFVFVNCYDTYNVTNKPILFTGVHMFHVNRAKYSKECSILVPYTGVHNLDVIKTHVLRVWYLLSVIYL